MYLFVFVCIVSILWFPSSFSPTYLFFLKRLSHLGPPLGQQRHHWHWHFEVVHPIPLQLYGQCGAPPPPSVVAASSFPHLCAFSWGAAAGASHPPLLMHLSMWANNNGNGMKKKRKKANLLFQCQFTFAPCRRFMRQFQCTCRSGLEKNAFFHNQNWATKNQPAHPNQIPFVPSN